MTDEPTELQPEILEFLSRMGLRFEAGGMPGVAGRILAWLLVAEEPLQSSSALRNVLQTTSGSISTATRLLEQASLVERVKLPGQRELHFRLTSDAMSTSFQQRADEMAAFRVALTQVLAALPERSPESLLRLRGALAFAEFMEEEIPALLARWRERACQLVEEPE